MTDDPFLQLLAEALPRLQQSFAALPAVAEAPAAPRMAAVMAEVAARLGDNYPYFHPLYAGQMLKPPHPVARAAYALAMWLNPNNHALDGGRASSRMEIEAVEEIAAMFGWRGALGHLTGGGTVANLEALWIAGKLAPGKRIVASSQAHYTHSRISAVLQLDFTAVPADARGRMDMAALEAELRRGAVGAVVATLGTTAAGAVDPLDRIVELRRHYGFRIHVDAAYGGYFTLIAPSLAPETRRAFEAIGQADSIVLDPHKHGLQPYGCGSVLFHDPSVGRFYRHESPYTYFTSADLHLGEISLECSRAGASAVALWATQRLLPLVPEGEFARELDRCRTAALAFHARLAEEPQFISPFAPELDIVNWAVKTISIEESSRLARALFERAAQLDLHLALAELPVSFFPAGTWPSPRAQTVTCLRSVLMKPEHLAWMEAIWTRLRQAVREAL